MHTPELICLVSRTETTNSFISDEINNYFADSIEILQWPTDAKPAPDNLDNCRFCLTTSASAVDAVKDQIPSSMKILKCRRTINLRNIHKLFELKENTNAILVQNSLPMAETSIEILHSLGIDHINFVPFTKSAKELDIDNIDVAISTGLPELVPEGMENVIDLGTNIIDISTYAEMTSELSFPSEILDEISRKYNRKIITITMTSLRISRENESLKYRLETIINAVHEALVAIDPKMNIVMVNMEAERLLNIRREDCIGKNVKVVLPELLISECLYSKENVLDDIRERDGNYLVVNKILLKEEVDHVLGVVATIRPTSYVQNLDVKIRKSLVAKGHVAVHHFADIKGSSRNLKDSIAAAEGFADTSLNILLVGESGTGKELFAQSIHNASRRRDYAFVAVNFAALPDNLAESELFGFEEGAFTGARKGGKAGLFEEAHNGTIFLDEIGDASINVQKKILRVIEEGQVRRVGGSSIVPVDVRIIAATHWDLNDLVRKKRFRSDLFFRLCTLPIEIPPLRARSDDIVGFVNFFSIRNYRRKLFCEPSLLQFFLNYEWPGNIRELENIVNYMCNVVPARDLASLTALPYYIQQDKTSKETPRNGQFEPSIVSTLLRSEGLLITYLAILDELLKIRKLNRSIGRNSLVNRLVAQGIPINDYQMKTALKKLENLGFVSAGKTKQGSRITELGENFVAHHRNENVG